MGLSHDGKLPGMQKLHSLHGLETVGVFISGHVQGVGFRAATVRQAHALGLGGWVRNTDDHRVEALLQGKHDAIDRMLSWLLTGPPTARVENVDSHEVQTERFYDRFEQI